MSPNMKIVFNYDTKTLIKCLKASDIIINPDIIIKIKIDMNHTYRITPDIVIFDSSTTIDVIDFLTLWNTHVISCDTLLANFRTEKLKQLI